MPLVLSIHNEGEHINISSWRAYRYPSNILVEALALAKGKNRIRVAVAGFPDTLELRRSGDHWFTEAGQLVEFEFLMTSSAITEAAPPAKTDRGRAAKSGALHRVTSVC